MKFVWIIAILLFFLIGFGAAANFLAVLLMGSIVLLFLTAVFMVLANLFKGKLVSSVEWLVGALFWGWILSICL